MRRQGGWLPGSQDALEEWLAGHRERVAAKGEHVPLHPVLAEFQALIDSDPVVRMYVNEMIAQVPQARQYRQRHLESVQQMLRLINEVLTMAPEYNEDAMVILPLGAILDWTMGTTAGFAAFRDRRINAMLKKVLSAWCEFLSSGEYPLRPQRLTHRLEGRGRPAGHRHRAVPARPRGTSTGASRRGTTSSPGTWLTARARSTPPTTTASSSARASPPRTG